MISHGKKGGEFKLFRRVRFFNGNQKPLFVNINKKQKRKHKTKRLKNQNKYFVHNLLRN
jgi:glutathione peroxidase-family protein